MIIDPHTQPDRLAVRAHRRTGNRPRPPEDPRRLRPAGAERDDADPPVHRLSRDRARSPNVPISPSTPTFPVTVRSRGCCRSRADHLVSIYLPTSPITPRAEADRIAFKNLAGEAIEQLEAAGAEAPERRAVDEALTDLHDDREFWGLQAHSLAVFAETSGLLRSFRLPNQLTEALQVADRYYVKPLLRTVTFPQTAFVLALAEGRCGCSR